ncbi:Nucleoporin NDC1 [Liparis tanakae]|uniref:Nucleoporin NDC1 n=1 Tax=Liparis tanakae TaxID=230148 RepID=A0A4Z2JFL2_9TELE|nr:Nucleoporin NDC1 [Liparis tanakae]
MATSNGKGEKVSKFETLKLLEKCSKERDDAMHRESVLREKLRQNESKIRATEAVRQKLKSLIMENKELRKQVKALRTEIGLERSPDFSGKTTKDIIDDLQEKDRECSSLVEKTGQLNLTIDVLTSEVANTVTSKTLLEDKLQSLQQNLKDMTHNQRRLLKLWDDKKVQREQLALPAIAMKPVQKPFVHKAVVCWRAVASIAWAVLLLLPITAIFVILSRFSLLHPIQTSSECLSFLTCASAIFSLILMCGVIIMVGFLNLEYYTVIPTIACSRMALLGQLLHPRQFVNSLAHCIMGIIVAWCCAVTIGGRYETIGCPCTQGDGTDGSPQMCLNEYHLILLLAGAFVGFSHSLLGVISNINYVSFHSVQQYKYLRFKGSLSFVVNSVHPLDSIAGLLDLSLLYHQWISAGFLLFTWNITLLLFRIFVTEDVALLSQNSPSRRCEVFSLSQPGGHPHNWNAISKECLSLLADLTQRLVAYHDTVATNGRAKSLSTGSERKTSSETSFTSSPEDLMSPRPTLLLRTPASVFARSIVGNPHSPLTAPFTPDLDSPFSSPALRRLTAPLDQCSPWFGTVQSPHIMRRAPKLWSTPTDSQVNGSPPASPASVPSPKQESFKPSRLALFLQNRKEQLPEASSQALFADSQAHIWALEGLSYLVQASFSEDQFGVVQTTLPSILGCMLILQEAVDRHFKLPHASSKPVRSASGMGDSAYKTLRFALRATLKTAIYRITTTFGNHLNAVKMSAEHRKRLQQFLEYKE